MIEKFNGSKDLHKSVGLPAALQRAADVVSLIGAWIAGLCIVALTLLVLVDTALASLSRILPFLPNGTHIGWEYSAYFMGSAFLLGSGMTLRAGLQLRVELTMSSKRQWLTRMFETFSSLLGTVISTSLTIWLFNFTMRTYGYGEVSDSFTPLWIPQAVLTLGAGVLAFQMIARLVTSLTGGTVNNLDLGAASAIE
ncbi:TRAP transporter small permease subunit [Pacificibacter marinus]|uniref:TRAP transporter small permease protein n=1 Tax=Pacificibacter marinus TaxID=658057 RepID=A0A1Y5T871_9RHOB|nr:TRAP transporter small permease subunit [Pacificibacter marinus]SEL08571.1 TRAP-type mannitol/chloroaromatic compound transport system, small permease component [Pacificibacter marinus]SLN57914.1 Tripartite ATP-independent periplasmic transporters, DctQ component [Pacificibacter marinus]